jgi:hypothetical protein
MPLPEAVKSENLKKVRKSEKNLDRWGFPGDTNNRIT